MRELLFDDEQKPKRKRKALPKISWDLDGGFVNVQTSDMKRWKESHPSIDIPLELTRMNCWLASNPRQIKKNYRRFITNWLARVDTSGNSTVAPVQMREKPRIRVQYPDGTIKYVGGAE